MTVQDRIGVINEARRSNVRQGHKVSTPREHASDLVSILLAAVAEGDKS